jgi:WD40 repeat protein
MTRLPEIRGNQRFGLKFTWGLFVSLVCLIDCGTLQASDDPLAVQPNVERPSRICKLAGQPTGRLFPAISQDGRVVVAGGSASSVMVWNADNGGVLRTFEKCKGDDHNAVGHKPKGHEAEIIAVAISTDGRLVASSGPARMIKIDGGMSMAYRPDGSVINLWDVSTGKLIQSVDPGSVAEALSFADVGKSLVAVILAYDLRSWNVATGLPTFNLIKDRWSVRHYYEQLPRRSAFSSDGHRVAALSNGECKLFDLTSGVMRAIAYDKRMKTPEAIAITGDGKKYAIVSSDHALSVWNFESGKLLRLVSAPLNPSQDPWNTPIVLAFDSKGNKIAAGSMDGVVRIWNDDGSDHPSRTIAGPLAPVRAFACTEKGFRVVSGGCDSPQVNEAGSKPATLTVWDIGPGPVP